MSEKQASRYKDRFTELDDYLIHQTVHTMNEMGSGEPDWMDHVELTVRPMVPVGAAPFLFAIWQVVPNLNMMYGYGYVVHNNVQHSLGVARELQGDRTKTVVGPLTRTVIQPLRQWHLSLAPNPHIPVTFDVALEAKGAVELSPVQEYEDPSLPGLKSEWRSTGIPATIRSGWITVDNKTYDLRSEIYRASLGHCWGLRSFKMATAVHIFLSAWFKDAEVHLGYRDMRGGEEWREGYMKILSSGQRIDFTKVEVDWEFERETRETVKGEFIVTDATGKARHIKVKRVSRGAYYNAAWVGEGPGRVIAPYHAEGVTWDLSNRETLIQLAPRLRQQHAEVEMDGEVGYAFLAVAISKASTKYGPQIR